MRFLHYLIKINDIYFISTQIKNINIYFDIFFNTKTQLFEVHDTSKYDSFIISYNKYPDQNLIKKLYQTSKENSKKFLETIQNENNNLLKNINTKLINDAKDKFNEILSFAEKSSNELSIPTIKKIINKEEYYDQRNFKTDC